MGCGWCSQTQFSQQTCLEEANGGINSDCLGPTFWTTDSSECLGIKLIYYYEKINM